jgi:hypothetical protein
MKAIENLGEWVLETGWLWVMFIGLVLALVMCLLTAAHSVSIQEQQFECTATDAVGIKARCLQYTARPFYREIGNSNEATK